VAGVVGMLKNTTVLRQAAEAQSRPEVESRRHGVITSRKIKRTSIPIAIIASLRAQLGNSVSRRVKLLTVPISGMQSKVSRSLAGYRKKMLHASRASSFSQSIINSLRSFLR